MLALTRPSWATVKTFIAQHHRHHKTPPGGYFWLGAEADDQLVAVAVVGRPVARMLAGRAWEVTRLCSDGTRNACSFLYAACWREARRRGCSRLVTYILESEPGISLRAAGWIMTAKTKGGGWSRPSRSRPDSHPLEPKTRWEAPP